MKVGTDSLVLGSWAPVTGGGRHLDIGCGSGVVGIETLNRLKSPKELILLEPQVEFLEYIQNNLEFIKRNIEGIS